MSETTNIIPIASSGTDSAGVAGSSLTSGVDCPQTGAMISSGVSGEQSGPQKHRPPVVFRPAYAVELAARIINATSNNKNLFINHLIETGFQAACARDRACLLRVGAALLSQAEALSEAGLYFQALGLNASAANRAQVRAILERVSASRSDALRAHALLALGTTYFDERDYICALRYYSGAVRACARPEIVFHARNNLAVICGEEGNYNLSDELLQSKLLLGAQLHPALHFSTLNNLASSLLQLGQISEAARVFRPVAASPFFQLYREWGDTAREIERETRAQERRGQIVDLASRRQESRGAIVAEVVGLVYRASMAGLRRIRECARRAAMAT